MADTSVFWIQTLDLFIPKTQPLKRAQIPQTTNLQTLWSLKYSIDTDCLCVKTTGGCLSLVSTQQNEMSPTVIEDLWFCLARALGAHLFGGLRLCGANKQQTLHNHRSHLNRTSSWRCWTEVVCLCVMWTLWPEGKHRDTWLAQRESGEPLMLAAVVFDVQFFCWRSTVGCHWRAGLGVCMNI